MQTQSIVIFEPNTSEEIDALKAFGKALKLKFKISESNLNNDRKDIVDNITKGLIEVNKIEKGEKKGTLLKEFLNEV